MADLVTVAGGAHASVKSLTAAEHHAAVNALSKLSSTHGVASVLGGSLRSASLSGGAHSSSLTFAHSAAAPATDHAVSGSAFAATGAGHASLSGDTINLAGTTAASVKNETVQASKAAGHTITMSDKTTITVTGVAHDVVKAH